MPSCIVVLVAQLRLRGLPDQLDEDDGDAGDSEEVGNEKSDSGILMGSSVWEDCLTTDDYEHGDQNDDREGVTGNGERRKLACKLAVWLQVLAEN